MKNETIKLYPDRNDVTLTTYVLDVSRELIGAQKRPAVLICPGGGYRFCSDREAEPLALRFAAMGYHAFVLRYSTYFGFAGYSTNFNYDEIKPIPEIIHPSPLRDLGKAMLIVKEHADEWLVDTNKIIILGCSAGGHLCAMFATNWYKPVLSEYFNEDPEKFRPAAAILNYPLTDFAEINKHINDKATREQQKSFEIINLIVTGTAKPSLDVLEEISPTLQVNEKTPPMFIWTTQSDTIVPVQQILLLGTALANNGIPFEMHIFEEGVHGLSLASQATANVKIQVNAAAAKWIDLAEAWLMKRFALDIPVNQTLS